MRIIHGQGPKAFSCSKKKWKRACSENPAPIPTVFRFQPSYANWCILEQFQWKRKSMERKRTPPWDWVKIWRAINRLVSYWITLIKCFKESRSKPNAATAVTTCEREFRYSALILLTQEHIRRGVSVWLRISRPRKLAWKAMTIERKQAFLPSPDKWVESSWLNNFQSSMRLLGYNSR